MVAATEADQAFHLDASGFNHFAQGYVKALLSGPITVGADAHTYNSVLQLGFSDLAPATGARIIADCKEALADPLAGYKPHVESGRMFWRDRQANMLNGMDPRFPPLTPHLGEDGKVYLREGAP